jgi:heme A synthase
MNLEPVTLPQIWLHFAHRLGAILVTAVLLALVTIIIKRRRNTLLIPALILTTLLLAQLTLGILTVYFRKPADIASLHVAVGALVLVTTFAIAVIAIRLYSVSRSFAEEQTQMEPQMNTDEHRSFDGALEPVLSV